MDHSVDKSKYICDGVVIRRNICSGVRHSSLEYAAGIALSKATNCKVYNNVCYNNKAGIALDLVITTNNQIYNNTLDGNDAGLWFGSTGTGNVVKNNIFSNNKNYGIRPNTNLIYDYNLFYNNGKNYAYGSVGTHDVNGDPKYVDRTNHNYQLSSTSASIDKGVSISGLLTDILGNLIQNKVDIGAYEYTNSKTSTIPSVPSLSSPSNAATGVSLSPTFNWNSASGAASYRLQVSTSSNFSSTIYDNNGLTSTSKQLAGLSEDTKYFWRLNASNSFGTSSWSSVNSFTTQSSVTSGSNGSFNEISSEKGTFNGDVRLKTKTGSIGSKVLYFLNTYSTAKYTVNLDKSGQWYAWGRMFFESSGSPRSSFYLQVDNGPKLIFGGDDNSFDKWHWEGSSLAKLPIGNLSSGSHTITIYGVPGESGETVLLDQILLTADASLIASDNLTQGSNSNDIVNSADNASLSGDVKLKTKSGSIGTKVLYFLNTFSTAKFTVNLAHSGQWYAWGRMFFEASGSPRSSFYLQVDNGPKLTFGGDDNNFNKWHWEGNGLSKLSIGNLSSGTHTITIYGRAGESGPTVMLDQLLLTSDPSIIATDNVINGGNGGNGDIISATENATLNGDVHLKVKAGSIGSKVLYFLNTYSTAKFTVNLNQSGQWYAWGRMFFESSGSPRSSFYIQVDNDSKLIFGGDDNSFDKWHWEGNGLSKLSLGNLSAGSHTITLYGVPSEGGETVMLDQILISSNANLSPSDNTIFNKAENDSLNANQSETDTPENYKLSQNYPNPFNPSTTIQFSIPKDGIVSLKVYNILGAEVASLINENKSAGTYEFKFDGSNLSSGIYLYKLITPNFVEIKKMMLVK